MALRAAYRTTRERFLAEALFDPDTVERCRLLNEALDADWELEPLAQRLAPDLTDTARLLALA